VLTVAEHAPLLTVAALAGATGATVKIESKSALTEMYKTDFFGRSKARLDVRMRTPKGNAN
jgi:hypothetical protein